MRGFRSFLLAAALPLLGASGCHNRTPADSTPQGWDDGARDGWYVADQGSRLIPQRWMDALEQPDGSAIGNGKFTDPAYLTHFGYIAASAYARRDTDTACPIDQKLPLGFVTDCQDATRFGVTKLQWLSSFNPREPWVGMNCAACHTNVMEFHYSDGSAETKLIDGAPTLADFQGFMAALETALRQTHDDDARFTRFAAAILPASEAEADKPRLRQAMASLIDWNEKLAALNDDGNMVYGFGRLDAIGHIFNKVALAAFPDRAQNSNPSDAPVSYPFLWNVPQLNKVEWNGIAPNMPITFAGIEDPGALVRNTGEVTGVFADVTLTKNATWENGYTSSARIDRLDQMEQQLRSLHAPQWPAKFGLNQTKDVSNPAYARSATRGETLFKTQCSSCHTVPTGGLNDTSERLPVALTPLAAAGAGEDMWMACNASFDTAQSGTLAGEPLNIVIGDKTPLVASNFSMLRTVAIGTLLGQKRELADAFLHSLLGFNNGLPQPPANEQQNKALAEITQRTIRANKCFTAMNDPQNPHYDQLVYKGRALRGIWATAPYLHNGSVPSLYTLLLPSGERPKDFCVGSHVFDPKEVGFEYKPPCNGTFEFHVSPPAGAASACQDPGHNPVVCGNSNWGHDYGNAALSDDDRYAIIEYLKVQ